MIRFIVLLLLVAPGHSQDWQLTFNNYQGCGGYKQCENEEHESQHVPSPVKYVSEPVGVPETFDYRVFIRKVGIGGTSSRISPWHDIPMMLPNGAYNAVTEIPQWTRAKYEVITDEQFNPIFQDVKNGNLRYYAWGDISFNYGMIPQTFEDPNHMFPVSSAPGAQTLPGDGDPVDMIEIGLGHLPIGAVSEVRILGALALIDDGEMDWKIATVRLDNPLAKLFHSLEDVLEKYPGALEGIAEWWRVYKVAAGGVENSIGFGGVWLGADEAKNVLATSHALWRQKYA